MPDQSNESIDLGPIDYSPALYRGQKVYLVETHKVTLETNRQYQSKEEKPPCTPPKCEYEKANGPDLLELAAQELLNAMLKAAASEAGLPPQLASFAGPLVKQAAKGIEDFVKQQGGDIQKLLVTSGMTETFAACKSFTLLVPAGSKIVSIDGFTDRETDKAGHLKKTDGPISGCTEEPSIDGLKLQCGPWSAWKYIERGNIVQAILMNWSHDENLDANLRVTFIPPAAWAAKHPRHSSERD